MPLLQVLQHVSVALDQYLRVLLSVTQLLVPITLNAFQKVRHKNRLFLQSLLLHAFLLLVVTFNLRQLFKLLQLVCQVLEVGGAVVVLSREVFLLEGAILGQLFRFVVFVRRGIIPLSQCRYLFLLLFL